MTTMPLGMVAAVMHGARLGEPRAVRMIDPEAQRRACPHDERRVEAGQWNPTSGHRPAARAPEPGKRRWGTDWRALVRETVEAQGPTPLVSVVTKGQLAKTIRNEIEAGQWPGYIVELRRGPKGGNAMVWAMRGAST